jgi:hypothetical protein
MTKDTPPKRASVRNRDRKSQLLAQATDAQGPPDYLVFRSDEERAYYVRLLRYRAYHDWLDADFDRLKRASEIYWDILVNDDLAADEFYVMTASDGKPFINPRFVLLERLQKTHDSVLRSLQITTAGMSRQTVAKRRTDARAAAEAVPTDRLLARPAGAKDSNVIMLKGDR